MDLRPILYGQLNQAISLHLHLAKSQIYFPLLILKYFIQDFLCTSRNQQTHQRRINGHYCCFNIDIWLKMKIESTYVYQSYFNVYDSQIVHHNPCFNLFILHNNLFDNQGSEINKNDIFLRFDIAFYKNFLPTTHSINLRLPIMALVLDFARN